MKFSAILLILSGAACTSMSVHAPRETSRPVSSRPADPFAGPKAQTSPPGAPETGREPLPPLHEDAQADRKIVFKGALTLQVADVDAAERDIRATVESTKGWVHRIDGTTYTLRVPVAHFMSSMDAMGKLGRILERRIAGADVTDEYRDLALRLDNAEKLRQRIAALLEKTKDVKEALDVERELARVTEEVERLKGKLNAMGDAVTYSTIVVSLQRTAALVRASSPAPRYPFPWVRGVGLEALMQVGER